MSHLKLTLLQNAVSFAADAIQNALLAETKPERWKFAIFGMTQAVELSLKERLRLEHQWFIYANIDRGEASDLKTVDADQARTRLQKIVGIKFSSTDLGTLKLAQAYRNTIVHYDVDHNISTNANGLKPVFSRLFGFLHSFHRDHLQNALHDLLDKDLWRKAVGMKENFEDLINRKAEEMKEDGVTDEDLVTCPSCFCKALPAEGDNSCYCYICGSYQMLLICDKCHQIVFKEEEQELGGSTYCQPCYDHIIYESDDFWHDDLRDRTG